MDADQGLAPDQEQAVRELLTDALGTDAALQSYRVVGQRPDYWVLLAAIRAGEQVVVKLAGPRAPFAHPFGRLAAIHRLLAARTAVPIAPVLAWDDTPRRWPWRYLIQGHVAGQELARVWPGLDADQQNAIAAELGAAVAALHGLRFSAWGDLGADGTVELGTTDPAAALAARARTLIQNPAHLDVFVRALDERRALLRDLPPPALVHDDLHHFNVLVQEDGARWRLAAILDFDKSWAGMGESDLARMELWSMTGDRFWQAYQEINPLAPGYAERRPLLQLLWCLEYAVPTPAHHADTALICAQLGIPPVQFG